MHIVLDTNVLVSGLLNPNGAPGRILDLILDGKIQLLYDDRILGEYQEVLLRPELSIQPGHVQAILSYFRLAGKRVSAMPLFIDSLPDQDDLPFIEVAMTGEAEAIVTGNRKHFVAVPSVEVKIYSPQEFLKLIQRNS